MLLECDTSKFKLKQADFFLQKIDEVYTKDDYSIEFYLYAFLSSCKSALDYVVGDFLNSIKPRISGREKIKTSKEKFRIAKEQKIKNFEHEKKN